MTRVRIDPNVRIGPDGRHTYTGREDADGPVKAGDEVTAYEEETGLAWPATVCVVTEDSRLIYLYVAWEENGWADPPAIHPV